jgi:hypothetical protein
VCCSAVGVPLTFSHHCCSALASRPPAPSYSYSCTGHSSSHSSSSSSSSSSSPLPQSSSHRSCASCPPCPPSSQPPPSSLPRSPRSPPPAPSPSCPTGSSSSRSHPAAASAAACASARPTPTLVHSRRARPPCGVRDCAPSLLPPCARLRASSPHSAPRPLLAVRLAPPPEASVSEHIVSVVSPEVGAPGRRLTALSLHCTTNTPERRSFTPTTPERRSGWPARSGAAPPPARPSQGSWCLVPCLGPRRRGGVARGRRPCHCHG